RFNPMLRLISFQGPQSTPCASTPKLALSTSRCTRVFSATASLQTTHQTSCRIWEMKWIAAFALLVAGAACSSSSTNSAASDAGHCVPGDQKTCPCGKGIDGFQTCRKDGSGYETCNCGSGGTGATGGSSATGGAGGASGGSGAGATGGTGAG